MSIDLSQFYQVFFEEAAEHLAEMERLLLDLDIASPNMDDLNAIFRAAHSIKGGSGTFGFSDIAEVTHVLETLLDRLRKQEMLPTDEMVNTFLEAGDVLAMLLAAHRGEGEVNQSEVVSVCAKLERLATGKPAADSGGKAEDAAVAASSSDGAYGFFEPLPELGASEADVGYGFFEPLDGATKQETVADDGSYGFFDPLPAETLDQEEKQGYGFFTETPVQQAEREKQQGYGFFQTLLERPVATESGMAAKKEEGPSADTSAKRTVDKSAAAHAENSSIRVSVEKVDQLINLVGELVITQAMLTQSATQVDHALYEKLLAGLNQLERNTRDLQESVMSIRMLPISFVFSRFPRVVRDLASKLGKQVDLRLLGETTEVDKGLVEKLADPLTHLVRNSLDHGIESPEKRMAAGKSAKGTITLNAYHQGGNIVIEVLDDGGGLNRQRILNKATERGLAVREDMPDSEVWQLIFEPGFSTAEVVTDVSGRGVGMDVVKRNITSLGGRIELDSAEGFGTRTVIRLPLTLAILDGLSVLVGNEIYIVPLNSIVESLQVSAGDLKSVSGEGRLLRVRGEYLPLLPLNEVFGTGKETDPAKGLVVIVESGGKKTAMLVDELLGQHQVVIKSLESNFRKVHAVSGATIMGDGKVALILDVAALAECVGKQDKIAA
ncbi:MAG: chemotaxis protein CheW [Pseudomonadota bacterium]